jgi:hypothetical protein
VLILNSGLSAAAPNPMKIASIISSNSHLDYVARVVDSLDSAEPPAAEDYGFGQFVGIPLDGGPEIVGVIYNSILVNPDYAGFGPRLSPKPELGTFSPDYLNEQGFLIAILLLGTQRRGEKVEHGVPRRVVPPGQAVFRIGADDVRRFHSDHNDCLQIHYFSQVLAHAGQFAVPLLEAVIDQLSLDCSESDRKRLGVLQQSLAWQRTMGGMRL